MALNPSQRYPNNTTPSSTNYPYGSAKDVTRAGSGDGYPFQQDSINDWLGFQQAILQAAGVTPTGNPDTAVDSQLLQALTTVITTTTNPSLAPLADAINHPTTGLAALSTALQGNDAEIATLNDQTASNAAAVTQEAQDRAAAIVAQTQALQADIASAINTAATGDSNLQGQIDTMSSSVTANTNGITAQGTRLTAAESGISTLDGSLQGAVTDITSLQSTVNNGTSGVTATYNAAVALQTRMDNIPLGSSTVTLEQLAVQVDGLAGGGGGFATTTELDAVEVKADTNTGDIAAQATQISALQSGVTGVQGTANTAINRLDNVNSSGNTLEQLQAQIVSNASSITTLQSSVGVANTTATAAINRIDNVNSSGNSLEQLQTTLANTATTTTTLDSQINTPTTGLAASITTQGSAITSLQNDVATQSAAYAIVANAGDSSAAIEITANGGAGSEINLQADRVLIDDGTNRVNLFDADGVLNSNFIRSYARVFTSNVSLSNPTNPTDVPLTDLAVTLPVGSYLFEIALNMVVSNVDVFSGFAPPMLFGFDITGAGNISYSNSHEQYNIVGSAQAYRHQLLPGTTLNTGDVTYYANPGQQMSDDQSQNINFFLKGLLNVTTASTVTPTLQIRGMDTFSMGSNCNAVYTYTNV